MVPPLVQFANNLAGTPSPMSQAYTNNVTRGNLLVAMIFDKSPSVPPPTNAVTDTLGNTWIFIDRALRPGVTAYVAMYYTVAATSGPCTVTYTNPNVNTTLSLVEFSSCKGTLDTFADGATNGGTSVTTSAFTTAQASEVLLFFEGDNGSGPTSVTAGASSMTKIAVDAGVYYLVTTSVQTGITATANYGGAVNAAAIIAAFPIITSILLDRNGPDWPLGFVSVATPGSPVGFMINVDPNNYAAPNTPTSVNSPEYSPACYEIMVQAMKPATHGTQNNTGNIYVVRKGQGTSNRDDTGVIVATVLPGQTLSLVAAALNLNVWSPYRYYLDADNPGDGAFITLIVQ